jgi:hypothetical protein
MNPQELQIQSRSSVKMMEWSCLNEWLTKEMARILSQMLKDVERSLGMRRRSSRSKVECFFKILEWSTEFEGVRAPFISPHFERVVGLSMSD